MRKLWRNYVTCGIGESHLDFHTLSQFEFINTFSLVGIFSALIFSIVNIFQGNYVLGISEIIFVAAGILNLVLLRIYKNHVLASNVILIWMFGFLLYLLFMGGIHRTGFLWYYTFPPLAYFLKGIRKGSVYIFALIAATFGMHFLDSFGFFMNLAYNYYEIRQMAASLAALSLLVLFYEKVRLDGEKKLKENEKEILLKNIFDRQFEDAGEIQRRFIPENYYFTKNNDIVGYYEPAMEIGGDYFDFFPLGDGRTGVIICDVSSKGIPAAMIMVKLRTIVKIYSNLKELRPDELLKTLNEIMTAELMAHMFITLVYMVIDEKTQTIEFSNAGHEPMLMFLSESKQLEWIEGEGIPVGIEVKENLYKNQIRPFKKDDVLVLYTDGITDMENKTGLRYGRDRLSAVLEKTAHAAAGEISEKIIKDVRNFSSGIKQTDDIALIVIKFK